MFILSVSENILSLVCGFGILQGILLAGLVYFHRKSDKSVNLFLALYIFSTSAIMSLPFIMKIIGWQNSFFLQPLPFLTGPFLYLYLRSFKETLTWRKVLPHLIWFVLFFFIAYWNISGLRNKYADAKDLPAEVLNSPRIIIVQYVRFGQQLLYYFLARKTLLSYQHSIRQLFSEISRIDLHWTRFLVNGFLILICAFMVIFPLMRRYPEEFNTLLFLNMAIATPYIYLAVYKGVLQPTIWQVQPGIKKETVEEKIHEIEEVENTIDQKPKTQKAKLNPEKIKELIGKMELLMEKEKLFQETELTLQQLALKLNVPTYQVSQALNDGMKKNFYDLVNSYRVEEAKRLLLDPGNTNYTILSVGFEAGFNSKTTFNTVFKKFTGFTPTEFRDRQRMTTIVE
ncbi:MAG TPA: helix-turn-helix domain-containing protein [Chitinophagaceae bacterium]|nr:helix-turn-helix domain-containing protein [Chitinophagaceae bacterium]